MHNPNKTIENMSHLINSTEGAKAIIEITQKEKDEYRIIKLRTKQRETFDIRVTAYGETSFLYYDKKDDFYDIYYYSEIEHIELAKPAAI